MAKIKRFEKVSAGLVNKKVPLIAVVNEDNGRVSKKLYVKDVMGKYIELVADTDYQTEFIIDSIVNGDALELEAYKQTLRYIETGKEFDKMRYSVNVTCNGLNTNIQVGLPTQRFGGNLGNSFVDTKFVEGMVALLFGVVLRTAEENEDE